MKRWFLSAARAYEREPELFLLAAGVVLVVVLWHLPVPAFLFADPGSGSAADKCACVRVEDCKDWSADPSVQEDPAVFEQVTTKDRKWTCSPSTAKCKLPDTLFIYEKGPPWCENVRTSSGNCLTVDRKTDCNYQVWFRDVTIRIKKGMGGNPWFRFVPTVKVDVSEFSDANKCQGSEGKFSIQTACYASMNACGVENLIDHDPDGNGKEDDNKNSEGKGGWYFEKRTFSKVGNLWEWDGDHKSTHAFSFNVNKDSPGPPDKPDPKPTVCNCNLEARIVHERLRFSVTVKENGTQDSKVKFGGGGKMAAVEFYLDTCDLTTCEIKQSPGS